MSDHEDRAAMEEQAERAGAKLAASIDALEAKAEHAKDSAVRDLKLIAGVAASAFAVKELLGSLARRREARDRTAVLLYLHALN